MGVNTLISILVGCFVGAAAGYLGSFMVLKRMSLVGDAFSHVALPGLALGIMFGFSPMLGAFAALLIAVFTIWHFESTTTVYPDALVGVFFTLSLAIGVLITPEPDLLEALFGSIEKITGVEAALAVVLSVLIVIIAKLISKNMILGSISQELLESSGRSYKITNLIYLLLVGLIVALGVRFVGSMLMGALVVIPAASAKNISRSMLGYSVLSAIFGVASALSGAVLGFAMNMEVGPLVVLSAVAIFVVTYLVKQLASSRQS